MSKQRKPRRRRLARRWLEYLDIPVETLPGVPKVTLLGRETVLIENHKGVLEYNAGCVRLITALGVIGVRGDELELKELGSELVTVTGTINSLSYEA